MKPDISCRRDALLAVFRDRRTDVIPVSTYGVDRYSHPWMAADDSYGRVLAHTDEHEHILALHLSYYASFGFTPVLGINDPGALERTLTQHEGVTHYAYRIRTPRGDLTAIYTENPGVHTVWRHDPLVKTEADIDRFLAAPFKPEPPDVAGFACTREALGERGLVEVEMPDPLCLVVENLSYEEFMAWTLTAPGKISAMLDRMAELLHRWLEGILAAGMGPVFRIFGPEYGAPPMMSPRFFRDAVVRYDRPLIDLIHRHGGFVRFHCHGAIRRILDEMLDMGVDATDPCEAPPGGDINLRELADRAGRDLVLMGNIQLDDIERAEASEIDRLVGEAVEAAGGRAPFILCTTAFPFSSPLPAVTERNLIRFLDAARRFGPG